MLSLTLRPSTSIDLTLLRAGESHRHEPARSSAHTSRHARSQPPSIRPSGPAGDKQKTHKSTPIVLVVASSGRYSSSVKRRRSELFPTEALPIRRSLRFGGGGSGAGVGAWSAIVRAEQEYFVLLRVSS